MYLVVLLYNRPDDQGPKKKKKCEIIGTHHEKNENIALDIKFDKQLKLLVWPHGIRNFRRFIAAQVNKCDTGERLCDLK